MTTLNFNGPYHFDEINNKTGEIIENNKGDTPPNNPGIYIWGFMYEIKNNQLGDPLNFKTNSKTTFKKNEMQFIPYYVGMRNDNIFKRIKEHHNVRGGNSTKYIRLSHEYMKGFFKDTKHFPIKTEKQNNVAALKLINKDNTSRITYFNSADCLSAIYQNITLKKQVRVTKTGKKYNNYPITDQKYSPNETEFNINIPDTLDDLVNGLNNFWFCYAPIKDEEIPIIEQLEANTFWSLKGLTASETISYKNIKTRCLIRDNTNSSIFKTNESGKIIVNEDFIGY